MSVNIENIMKEIRQEIKEKGYTYDMLSFNENISISATDTENISFDEINQQLSYLNNNYSVVSYRPLNGNKLAVFIKKVIRKLTKFYVEPIVASQNEFNAYNVRTLNALVSVAENSRNNDKKQDMDALKEKISVMELQLKTNASEICMLNEKIAKLEKELNNKG